jgi:hypothetical protein
VVVEPVVEDVAAEGRGQIQQFRNRELRSGGDGGSEAAEKYGVFRRHAGSAEQGWAEVASRGLEESGDRFETQSVPEGIRNGVGGIFAEGEGTAGGPRGDGIAGHAEQWAAEREWFPRARGKQGRNGFHAAETGAAAQQIGEDGFHLIVGVVGEENRAAAVSAGAGSEETVTRMPPCRFKRKTVPFRLSPDVCGSFHEGKREPDGQLPDESGVLVRVAVAQLVIEVADDDAVVDGCFVQGVQQDDRVDSSGDGGEQGCIAGVGGEEGADGCGGHGLWVSGNPKSCQSNRGQGKNVRASAVVREHTPGLLRSLGGRRTAHWRGILPPKEI